MIDNHIKDMQALPTGTPITENFLNLYLIDYLKQQE